MDKIIDIQNTIKDIRMKDTLTMVQDLISKGIITEIYGIAVDYKGQHYVVGVPVPCKGKDFREKMDQLLDKVGKENNEK